MLKTSSSARLICCLFVMLVALGQTKVVTLKDGRKISGKVTETKTGLLLETEFGTIAFSREDVLSIEDFITPEKEYQQELAKIDPKDPEGHYAVARWALKKDYLEIAKKELLEALKLKPDADRYSLTLREVERRIERTRPTTPRIKIPGKKPPKPIPGRTLRPEWLLSMEDIYRLRLEELRPTDVVSIEFRNVVLERFVDMMYGKRDFREPWFADRFFTYSPTRKAVYILGEIGHEDEDVAIKDDIIIKTDPRFMIDFRSRVWPIVARSCATSSCHGSGDKPKGGLKLFNVAGRNERVDYTNFVILDGFRKDGQRVINRDHVERSLLLQFGLPPEQAKFKHPHPGITRVFRSRRESTYRVVFDWIESLQGPPHPDYRLKYRPPFGMKMDLSGAPGLSIPTTAPAATQPTKSKPPLKAKE